MNWYKFAALSLDEAYRFFNVSPDIDLESFKEIHRKLRRELHPDTNKDPNAHEKYVEMEEAARLIEEDITGKHSGGGGNYFYGVGFFTNDKMNELWGEILQALSLDETSVLGDVSPRVRLDGSMAYYDWNAVFDDYEFCGMYGQHPEYEYALLRNGKDIFMAGLIPKVAEVKNNRLINAINSFYSLVMKLEEAGELNIHDYNVLRDLFGDFELYLLDNILFDVFDRKGVDYVHYIEVRSAPSHILPSNFKEYTGLYRIYAITSPITKEELDEIISRAHNMSFNEAYDLLFSRGVYIDEDVYSITADDVLAKIASWKADLLSSGVNAGVRLQDWYRKMIYIITNKRSVVNVA